MIEEVRCERIQREKNSVSLPGGTARQIACKVMNLIKVYLSLLSALFAFLFKLIWHILFSQSFEELAMCSQNVSCGQCDVSNYLAYRHILKSIVQELKRKKQK